MIKSLIALSGGVDSSVAAYLSKEMGYDTCGITLKLNRSNDSEDNSCVDLNDIALAKQVCEQLGIEHKVIDFCPDFEKNVIDRFVNGYLIGETPNPCVDCNRYIKFPKMFELADEMGAEYVVTGHYANIEKSGDRYLLKKGAFDMKDQSYVLYSLNQSQLSRIMFPIGNMKKDEVRQLASSLGFLNSNKPDSQDICFVKDNDYVSFIERRLSRKFDEGDFVDRDGNYIAKHKGIISYTIGQRKGLGIASTQPYYVIDKDVQNNRVILGRMEDQFRKSMSVKDVNFIPFDKLESDFRCSVKIRYKHSQTPALLTPLDDGRVQVVFDEPQKAVTKGQSAVFYDGDYVVGGGKIE